MFTFTKESLCDHLSGSHCNIWKKGDHLPLFESFEHSSRQQLQDDDILPATPTGCGDVCHYFTNFRGTGMKLWVDDCAFIPQQLCTILLIAPGMDQEQLQHHGPNITVDASGIPVPHLAGQSTSHQYLLPTHDEWGGKSTTTGRRPCSGINGSQQEWHEGCTESRVSLWLRSAITTAETYTKECRCYEDIRRECFILEFQSQVISPFFSNKVSTCCLKANVLPNVADA